MKTSVGESERTSGKHALLEKLLGREVGIMIRSLPPWMDRHYTFMDLCAGDGRPSGSSRASSPQIINGYYQMLKRARVPAKMIFVERDKNTFANLLAKNYEALHFNIDATEIKAVPCLVDNNSAMFIHADPNHIEDWPISPELLISAPKFTTLLVTMGCNVGGLKRLPLEARQPWFSRMDNLLGWMPKRHDALLISLLGDGAQWAYLIIGPGKWQGKHRAEARNAFKAWPWGLEMVGYRTNKAEFFELRDRLFLTTRERDANA